MSVTGVGEVADLIKDGLDRFFPNKSDEEKAQMQAAMLMVQGQLDVNKAEAANPNWFVAGWRPFIGWVCGASCAWNWVGLPVALFAANALGHPLVLKPADLSEMSPVLIGMLGLGGLRTYEKATGGEGNRS